MSGGKFINGAVTGAFGYLFNELSEELREQHIRYRGEFDTSEIYDPYVEGIDAINRSYIFEETALTVVGVGPGARSAYAGARYGYRLTVDATLGALRSVAELPIFRPGTFLNSGQYLRIGVGRYQGKRWFRISGDFVGKVREHGHIRLLELGPWP